MTPSPFGVMGIVNLTPDSFYDGGQHNSPVPGIGHALALREQGADILDLGAESSRPGAAELLPRQETERLLPVLAGLRRAAPAAVLSVDTYHAETAAAVLQMGVSIINDISACAFDPALLDVLVQYKPGYVLMHSQGRPTTMQHNPSYTNVRREVREFFEREMSRLVRAGLPENRIVLDPGIGFGKTVEQNCALTANLAAFQDLGLPLLMGWSRKSSLGAITGLPVGERLAPSVAAALISVQNGANILRVHDVAATRAALQVAQACNTLPSCM